MNKTKIMTNDPSHIDLQKLIEKIEQVKKFKYLGSEIESNTKDNSEINKRRCIAFAAFWDLTKIWKSKDISLKQKLIFFQSICLSILLYGCETWILSNDLINKLDSFATICYRYILQISKIEKVSNDEILKIVNRKPLHELIQERQLKFVNNVQSLDNNNIFKKYLFYTPLHGKNKVGRPRTTYEKYISKIIENKNRDRELIPN